MEYAAVTPAGQGEHLLVISDVVTIKVAGDQTDGQLVVVEVMTPPGGGPPILHRHRQAESFSILDGEFEVTIADQERRTQTFYLTAGDTCAIPPMVWHTYKNVGTAPGRFIAAMSPSGLELFFRELGLPLAEPRLPPPAAEPPSEEQRRQLMAIITKHMEVLVPEPTS